MTDGDTGVRLAATGEPAGGAVSAGRLVGGGQAALGQGGATGGGGRRCIMVFYSGFCSVKPSVNPNSIFTVENPDLVFDIGSGFTDPIPVLARTRSGFRFENQIRFCHGDLQ